ncbi:hypothetical protein ACWMTC_004768, partial [Escherichia coli]
MGKAEKLTWHKARTGVSLSFSISYTSRLFNGMQNLWPDNNVPELISAGYVKLSPHAIYLFSRVCH